MLDSRLLQKLKIRTAVIVQRTYFRLSLKTNTVTKTKQPIYFANRVFLFTVGLFPIPETTEGQGNFAHAH